MIGINMAQKLHKKRNQRLNMSNNTSNLDKGFNITSEDSSRVSEGYVVDCNKRGKDGTTNKKTRMSD